MNTSDQLVVEASGLVKHFGRTRALDGLDLRVRPGEVHGFLGPNGSGKSTAMRALLGLLRIDGGRVDVFGMDPWRDTVEIHRRVAYVPGDVALWPNLTGGETLDMLLRMGGRDPHGPDSRRDELIERFHFDPTKRARTYSRGNRQKVALIAAFAVRRDLLLLDEPTSGLDPLMEQVFNECLAEHVTEGTTVLLSSHILSEVERIAERVTIIHRGRTVQTAHIDQMRSAHRTNLRITIGEGTLDLAGITGVHAVSVDGSVVECSVDPEAMPTVIRALGRVRVDALTSTPPSLEDLFLDLYRDRGTDEGGAS